MARLPRYIAVSVACACGLTYLVTVILVLSTQGGAAALNWDAAVLLLLAFPIVGAIIVAKQPRNTIGWLLVISGASTALGQLGQAIVRATLDANPATWQEILAWLASNLFIGGFEGLLLALAFLFPTGRALSPRWRRAGIAAALAVTLSFGVVAIYPGPVNGVFSDTPQLTNPFGVPGLDALEWWLVPLGIAAQLFMAVTNLAAVVARVRRSRGVERLQIQWVALALVFVFSPSSTGASTAVSTTPNARWRHSAAGCAMRLT